MPSLIHAFAIHFFPDFANTLRRNLGVETRPGAHAKSGLSQTLSRVWNSITNWSVPKVANPNPPVYLATRLDGRRPVPKRRRPPTPRRRTVPARRPVYKPRYSTTTTTTQAPRVYLAATELPPILRVDNNYNSNNNDYQQHYNNNNNNNYYDNRNQYASQGLSSSSSSSSSSGSYSPSSFSVPHSHSWKKHTVQRRPNSGTGVQRRMSSNSLWKRLLYTNTTKRPRSHQPYLYYQPPNVDWIGGKKGRSRSSNYK